MEKIILGVIIFVFIMTCFGVAIFWENFKKKQPPKEEVAVKIEPSFD